MNSEHSRGALGFIDAHPSLAIDQDTGLRWPVPEVPEPDDETLSWWLFDGVAESTDGCAIEPDGVCEHGHPSWFRRLGLI